MRIIFLNSWFAKTGEPYFEYIKSEASKTDIFCFMEYSPDLFTKVSGILDNHNGLIEKGIHIDSLGEINCLAIFVRKGIKVLSSKKLQLYRNLPTDAGFAFYILFEYKNNVINLINIHGKSQPGHKKDIPERILQSQKIINFMAGKFGPKIIGGDFNLLPETESIKLFEDAGYNNLISDFAIKSTRNTLSWEQFQHQPGFVKQYFADFCFVSPDIKVNNFEVPYNEVSDHLPLILDFSLD